MSEMDSLAKAYVKKIASAEAIKAKIRATNVIP
jgi:hypothetical protein